MILYKDKDLRVLVADIETLLPCTDLGFYDPDEKKWYEFEMSAYKNQLFEFVAFYTSKKWDYVCGYNYKGFDAQVVEYIIENHQKWVDWDGLQISKAVHQCAQMVIDDSSYGLWAKYREDRFSMKVIDVYLIFGLDNEARRSSLKKCEFQIDYPSVEEMPVNHDVQFLTQEEVEGVKSYRRNDVEATYELLKMAIGQTEHPIYKGNNQIEMRIDIQEQFNIDCLNLSDIKIGETILKTSYAAAIGKSIDQIPREGTHRKKINLSKCVPSFVSFKTKQLQNLLHSVTKLTISSTDKLENKFEINGTKYIQALGGIHSVNRNEVYQETKEYKVKTYDVASLYPAIIVNNGYYPSHLGIELLQEYAVMFRKRLELKPLAKKDKKIKGIVDGYKIALNAAFGKIGDKDSWLYDKQCLLSVTLTGQFCLLMLIEAYEEAGFHVISANTDGVDVIVNVDREAEIDAINKEWEVKTNFILEGDEYKKIVYATVNDYIAITGSGKLKVKGDFIKDFELWKNKSHRIVPLALEAYFIDGKDPIQFIENHKNIYDFCIMARATGRLHLEEQWEEGNQITTKKHKKLIRYYLSSISNKKLYKRGISSTDKPMNVCLNANDQIGDIYVQYFNQFEEKENYNIDYRRYILPVLEKIDAIEKTKKAEAYSNKFKPQQQLKMF